MGRWRNWIRAAPVLGPLARRISRLWRGADPGFSNSAGYWQDRYAGGGDSGAGSAGRLAQFKAGVLNALVEEQGITSVIEFGCGDGRQLALARYPAYLGFDISPDALALCRKRFAGDATKRFLAMEQYAGEQADLAISLDVIFHLVEDDVYQSYMRVLFAGAARWVAVYSSDREDDPAAPRTHVRHRRFTQWVAREAPQWVMERHIPNPYPWEPGRDEGTHSFADFFLFRHAGGNRP